MGVNNHFPDSCYIRGKVTLVFTASVWGRFSDAPPFPPEQVSKPPEHFLAWDEEILLHKEEDKQQHSRGQLHSFLIKACGKQPVTQPTNRTKHAP